MNFLLFVEKEGLGCPSSPQLFSGAQLGGLLHLLYESKAPNSEEPFARKSTRRKPPKCLWRSETFRMVSR